MLKHTKKTIKIIEIECLGSFRYQYVLKINRQFIRIKNTTNPSIVCCKKNAK